jgi:hypothetical protein
VDVNWQDKLQAIEKMIDEAVDGHGKLDVRSQIPLYAESCANMQLRVAMAYLLSTPHLGRMPEDSNHSRFNTVFDVIGENIIKALTEHGYKYFDETYA